MRKGIVARNGNIKPSLNLRLKRSHICDTKGQPSAKRICLLLRSLYLCWTQVGSMNAIPSEGQPNCLCSNTAGTVENREWLLIS